MSGWEVFQIWLGAFLTVAIFSFMYKDNPLYKAAEHIFAGITAGYYVALYLDTVVYQQLWVPVTHNGRVWLIIPGILGIFMFGRLWPKLTWLARFGLAFIMGTTAGVFLASELHGNVLGQMSGTMQIQQVAGQPNYVLTALVVIGLLATLIYFYFSKPHTGVLGVTASVGIWFIMVSFGAHFGYTVMGRVSLLIGRVYFLYNDWIGTMR
ncbi:MAG: hypothetical protein HY851_05120 [candidate division Zixibacteria bacterium]|nr:hypothetical protein [candidate division Zixibacteria bacterium]